MSEELIEQLSTRFVEVCEQLEVRLHVVKNDGNPMTGKVGYGILARECLRQMEWARRIVDNGSLGYEHLIVTTPLTLAPPEWKA